MLVSLWGQEGRGQGLVRSDGGRRAGFLELHQRVGGHRQWITDEIRLVTIYRLMIEYTTFIEASRARHSEGICSSRK